MCFLSILLLLPDSHFLTLTLKKQRENGGGSVQLLLLLLMLMLLLLLGLLLPLLKCCRHGVRVHFPLFCRCCRRHLVLLLFLALVRSLTQRFLQRPLELLNLLDIDRLLLLLGRFLFFSAAAERGFFLMLLLRCHRKKLLRGGLLLALRLLRRRRVRWFNGQCGGLKKVVRKKKVVLLVLMLHGYGVGGVGRLRRLGDHRWRKEQLKYGIKTRRFLTTTF